MTDEDVAALMTEGIATGNRDSLGLMTMVARDRFAYFPDEERSDLYTFLDAGQ